MADAATDGMRDLDRLATGCFREAASKKRKFVERTFLSRVLDRDSPRARPVTPATRGRPRPACIVAVVLRDPAARRAAPPSTADARYGLVPYLANLGAEIVGAELRSGQAVTGGPLSKS
jgi:hypothetical protein